MSPTSSRSTSRSCAPVSRRPSNDGSTSPSRMHRRFSSRPTHWSTSPSRRVPRSTSPRRRASTSRPRAVCSTPRARQVSSRSSWCRVRPSMARGPTTPCHSPRTRRCGPTPSSRTRCTRRKSNASLPTGPMPTATPRSRSCVLRSRSRKTARAGSRAASPARRASARVTTTLRCSSSTSTTSRFGGRARAPRSAVRRVQRRSRRVDPG